MKYLLYMIMCLLSTVCGNFVTRYLEFCQASGRNSMGKLKIRLPNDPTVNAMFAGYNNDNSFIQQLRTTVDAMGGNVHLDGTPDAPWRTMTITLFRDAGFAALWKMIKEWLKAQRCEVPESTLITPEPMDLPGQPCPDFNGPFLLSFNQMTMDSWLQKGDKPLNPNQVPGGHQPYYAHPATGETYGYKRPDLNGTSLNGALGVVPNPGPQALPQGVSHNYDNAGGFVPASSLPRAYIPDTPG